jgi:hypothetical protein
VHVERDDPLVLSAVRHPLDGSGFVVPRQAREFSPPRGCRRSGRTRRRTIACCRGRSMRRAPERFDQSDGAGIAVATLRSWESQASAADACLGETINAHTGRPPGEDGCGRRDCHLSGLFVAAGGQSTGIPTAFPTGAPPGDGRVAGDIQRQSQSPLSLA